MSVAYQAAVTAINQEMESLLKRITELKVARATLLDGEDGLPDGQGRMMNGSVGYTNCEQCGKRKGLTTHKLCRKCRKCGHEAASKANGQQTKVSGGPQCLDCEKEVRFETVAQLRRHQRAAHPPLQEKFKCTIAGCPDGFKSDRGLAIHIARIHPDEAKGMVQ